MVVIKAGVYVYIYISEVTLGTFRRAAMGASSLLLFLFLLGSGLGTAGADRFAFNGFDSSHGLIFLQSSSIDQNKLSLTKNGVTYDEGRVVFPTPISFKDEKRVSGVASFSTTFIFSIQPGPEGLAEGLAFFIAPNADPVSNSSGGYLGLFNDSIDGNISLHTLAVEIDTYRNPEFRDRDDNHVAVNLNSIFSAASDPPVFLTKPAFLTSADGHAINLKSGQTNRIWIDFDGDSSQLNISISRDPGLKPDFPFFSNSTLNVSAVLQDNMYIGFSASNAYLTNMKYFIHAWSFSNEGPSPEIHLPSTGNTKATPRLLISIFASGGAVVFTLLGIFLGRRFWKKKKEEEENSILYLPEDMNLNPSARRFTYKELRRATEGFHDKNLLGRGGFGCVYHGVLPKGTAVAVKRVSKESQQGMKEFLAEVSIIGRLRHRNLVPLLGWCPERGLALVYEYMPNGSLDKYLFDDEEEQEGGEEKEKRKNEQNIGPVLTWAVRCRVLRGVASALVYLHEEWEQKVIHRDVKTSNVLLDAEFNARLGDFGLARLHRHDANTSALTNVVGTFGYLAPEYVLTRKITEKVDVYSFGALTAEVVTGKRIVSDNLEVALADRLWFLHTSDRLREAIDKSLLPCSDSDHNAAMDTLRLGLLCLHPDSVHRPSMRHVLQVLTGDAPPPTLPTSHPPLAMPLTVIAVSPRSAREDTISQ